MLRWFRKSVFPYGLVVSDFDHDQRPDIAVANEDRPNMGILLDDDTGGFLTVTNYSIAHNVYEIAAGDMNGRRLSRPVAAPLQLEQCRRCCSAIPTTADLPGGIGHRSRSMATRLTPIRLVLEVADGTATAELGFATPPRQDQGIDGGTG